MRLPPVYSLRNRGRQALRFRGGKSLQSAASGRAEFAGRNLYSATRAVRAGLELHSASQPGCLPGLKRKSAAVSCERVGIQLRRALGASAPSRRSVAAESRHEHSSNRVAARRFLPQAPRSCDVGRRPAKYASQLPATGFQLRLVAQGDFVAARYTICRGRIVDFCPTRHRRAKFVRGAARSTLYYRRRQSAVLGEARSVANKPRLRIATDNATADISPPATSVARSERARKPAGVTTRPLAAAAKGGIRSTPPLKWAGFVRFRQQERS